MTRTDDKAFRLILTIAEAAGGLAHYRLRLSKFEFDIVRRARIKQQAADAPSRLKTKAEVRTPLRNEVSVHAIFPRSLTWAPLMVEPELETRGESKVPIVLFIVDVCMLAGITDSEKAKTQTLSNCLTVQCTDSDCCTAFTSVRNVNTSFSVVSNGVLVRVSP